MSDSKFQGWPDLAKVDKRRCHCGSKLLHREHDLICGWGHVIKAKPNPLALKPPKG